MKTFEEYLKEKHFDTHIYLLDDDLLNHFDHWLSTLDTDELIQYSEDWCKKQIHLAEQSLVQRVRESIRKHKFDVEYTDSRHIEIVDDT